MSRPRNKPDQRKNTYPHPCHPECSQRDSLLSENPLIPSQSPERIVTNGNEDFLPSYYESKVSQPQHFQSTYNRSPQDVCWRPKVIEANAYDRLVVSRLSPTALATSNRQMITNTCRSKETDHSNCIAISFPATSPASSHLRSESVLILDESSGKIL